MNNAKSELEWWTKLGDMLIKITAALPKDDFDFKRLSADGLARAQGSNYTWEYSGLPAGEVVRWCGSDSMTPPSITVYWTPDSANAKRYVEESRAQHTMRFGVK